MTLSARLARAAQSRAQDEYVARVRTIGLAALLEPYTVTGPRVPEQRRRLAWP